MKLSYSLILAAASCGMAFGATTAYTSPVGYETLTLKAGANYSGLRLQESAVNSGVLTGVTAAPNTVSDTATTFALTTGTKYIVEFSPSGYIQLIDGAAAVGSTITTPDNLVGSVAVGSSYTIRPAATVVSVFGNPPTTLAQGFAGPGGADQLYIPDAAGVLKVYYYDSYGTFDEVNPGPGYYEVHADQTVSLVANPASITMPYDEGFIFGAAADTSLTVTGTVKTKPTMLAVTAGANYMGSVCPVGATLVTTFGNPPTGLAQGFAGPGGADQLYIVNGAGVLKVYYYDSYGTFDEVNPGPGYYEVNADQTVTLIADPSTITMSSGYIFGAAADANVLSDVPAAYPGL